MQDKEENRKKKKKMTVLEINVCGKRLAREQETGTPWRKGTDKVWVPELPQRADDDELIGEMDLAHEVEKNVTKASPKIQGLEQPQKYLLGIVGDLKAGSGGILERSKWQAGDRSVCNAS